MFATHFPGNSLPSFTRFLQRIHPTWLLDFAVHGLDTKLALTFSAKSYLSSLTPNTPKQFPLHGAFEIDRWQRVPNRKICYLVLTFAVTGPDR
jgi:hypothetical protein